MELKYVIPTAKCGGCLKKIKQSLSKEKSIKNIDMDLETKILTINSTDTLDQEKIVKQIKDLGYEINEVK